MHIRKSVIIKEQLDSDERDLPGPSVTRVAALVVVKNPLAGSDAEDLSSLFDIGAKVGDRFAAELAGQLPGPAIGYGKAALVGTSGSMEQGAATVHPRLGKPMRAAIGGGEALIPANVKVAAMGTAIDLPLGHKDNPWAFDYIDTMTLAVADAPRADEIVIIIALADGPRPHARVGSGPGSV